MKIDLKDTKYMGSIIIDLELHTTMASIARLHLLTYSYVVLAASSFTNARRLQFITIIIIGIKSLKGFDLHSTTSLNNPSKSS